MLVGNARRWPTGAARASAPSGGARTSAALEGALEREAWDGDWYRRAYFDDGTPLGSAANDECRIDSIAQSWGVISGAADPARARAPWRPSRSTWCVAATASCCSSRRPSTATPLDPGYIKGYLPGVRENGGQYTHAAVWSVIAFAALGDGDRAGELFAILNPINHASTRAGVHRYKVEPYVVAADVYAEPPHVGRGGWTWYTGSAGWMYRAGLEWILGFRLRGAGSGRPVHSAGVARLRDRVPLPLRALRARGREPAGRVPGGDVGGGRWRRPRRRPASTLADDGNRHRVRIVLGPAA